jgi:hypothetical protein
MRDDVEVKKKALIASLVYDCQTRKWPTACIQPSSYGRGIVHVTAAGDDDEVQL